MTNRWPTFPDLSPRSPDLRYRRVGGRLRRTGTPPPEEDSSSSIIFESDDSDSVAQVDAGMAVLSNDSVTYKTHQGKGEVSTTSSVSQAPSTPKTVLSDTASSYFENRYRHTGYLERLQRIAAKQKALQERPVGESTPSPSPSVQSPHGEQLSSHSVITISDVAADFKPPDVVNPDANDSIALAVNQSEKLGALDDPEIQFGAHLIDQLNSSVSSVGNVNSDSSSVNFTGKSQLLDVAALAAGSGDTDELIALGNVPVFSPDSSVGRDPNAQPHVSSERPVAPANRPAVPPLDLSPDQSAQRAAAGAATLDTPRGAVQFDSDDEDADSDADSKQASASGASSGNGGKVKGKKEGDKFGLGRDQRDFSNAPYGNRDMDIAAEKYIDDFDADQRTGEQMYVLRKGAAYDDRAVSGYTVNARYGGENVFNDPFFDELRNQGEATLLAEAHEWYANTEGRGEGGTDNDDTDISGPETLANAVASVIRTDPDERVLHPDVGQPDVSEDFAFLNFAEIDPRAPILFQNQAYVNYAVFDRFRSRLDQNDHGGY